MNNNYYHLEKAKSRNSLTIPDWALAENMDKSIPQISLWKYSDKVYRAKTFTLFTNFHYLSLVCRIHLANALRKLADIVGPTSEAVKA